jgi:hypothetical protein
MARLLANLAALPEPDPGHLIGNSPLQQIRVIEEHLLLDFRGLPQRQAARIRAAYRVSADKNTSQLRLVFVADTYENDNFRILLDGQAIQGSTLNLDSIPASWLAPDSIPALSGKIPYQYTSRGMVAFEIALLTAGMHELVIEYEANPGEWFTSTDLVTTRNLVYMLRPDDSWRRFENLHLKVMLPESWAYTSNLPLQQEAPGVFTAFWPELPATYVSFSLQKPQGSNLFWSYCYTWGAIVATLLLALWWQWKLFSLKSRLKYPRVLIGLNTLLFALLLPAICLYFYIDRFEMLDQMLDGHLNRRYRYGEIYIVFMYPLLALAALLIGLLSNLIFSRLQKR